VEGQKTKTESRRIFSLYTPHPRHCITFALCIPKLYVPWYKSFMSLLLTEYNTEVGRCGGIPYRRRILCQVFWRRSVRSEGVIWYGFTQGLRLKNTAQNDWRFLQGKSGEEKYQVKKKKSLHVAIQSAFRLRQGNGKRGGETKSWPKTKFNKREPYILWRQCQHLGHWRTSGVFYHTAGWILRTICTFCSCRNWNCLCVCVLSSVKVTCTVGVA